MKSAFQWLLILAVAALPGSSFGWNWDDAVSLTLAKNQQLKLQDERVIASTHRQTMARGLFYPSVHLKGGVRYLVNQNKEWQYRAYVGPRFRWMLYQGGKIQGGYEVSTARARKADLTRRLANIELCSKLRQALAEALFSKDALRRAKNIEDRRLVNVRFIEVRYQGGLEYRWVLSSSKAKWENAKLTTLEAKLSQRQALDALEVLTGPLPFQDVNQVSESGFYTDENTQTPKEVIANLEYHPRLQLLRVSLDEAGAMIDVAKAERYPWLGFQADTFLGSYSDVKLFPFVSVGGFLTMPLFEGGRIRSNVQVARANYRERMAEWTQSKLDLAAEIQQAYDDFLVAKKRMDVVRATFRANEDRAKVVSAQYEIGKASFLEWERSQDGWVAAEKALVNSVRNYRVARAKYEETLGYELRK